MTRRASVMSRAAPPPERFLRPALVIFAAALMIRLAHIFAMRTSPFFQVLLGDAHAYDAWARQIAGGDVLGRDVFYQAPLYAYFLAALYTVNTSLVFVRVCQAVIGAGACMLTGYASYRLFGRTAGLLAGLMLAAYAPAVFVDGLVQKSALDVFFISLLLALLSGLVADPKHVASPWRWFGVGVAMGALGLTRENALLFVPVVIAWLWLSLRRTRSAGVSIAAVLLGVSVILGPVALRNLIVGGELHLTTTQSGPNLFIGNNARADGTYVSLRSGRGSPEFERQDATDIASRALGRTLSPGEVSGYWTGRAFDYIRGRPLEWLALELRKLRLLSSRTEVIDTESQESHEDDSPPLRALAYVAHFGVVMPLAGVGVWLTWSERRRLWLLYALMLGYALSVLAFYVVARYRLPLVPFLTVFAAAGVARAGRLLSMGSWTSRALLAASLAVLTIVCNVPVDSADAMRAVSHHNLGAALQETGSFDAAADAYRRALEFGPNYAPAHNGLGSVLRRMGKVDEAIVHLEQALRAHPDFEDASFNLANALNEAGRASEAIARYEEIARRRPEALDVRTNLAIALAGVGRLDEAVDHLRAAVRLAPDTARVHFNLGQLLVTRGNLDAAVVELSQAMGIDPADAAVRYELGSAYLAQRRFSAAAEQFREAVRLSPRMVDAHNNLGIAMASMGQQEEAIAEFRTALRIDPASTEAQANLKAALSLRRSIGQRPE